MSATLIKEIAHLYLLRVAAVPTGLYGLLFLGNLPMCITLEPFWINNEKNCSCIPPGTYECCRYSGTRFKDVFLVKDVPGRSGILIHAGNEIWDTAGCILVGEGLHSTGIHGSLVALNKLRDLLPDNFKLTIKEGVYQ